MIYTLTITSAGEVYERLPAVDEIKIRKLQNTAETETDLRCFFITKYFICLSNINYCKVVNID